MTEYKCTKPGCSVKVYGAQALSDHMYMHDLQRQYGGRKEISNLSGARGSTQNL